MICGCWFCNNKNLMELADMPYLDERTGKSYPVCWNCCRRGVEWLDNIIEKRMREKNGN